MFHRCRAVAFDERQPRPAVPLRPGDDPSRRRVDRASGFTDDHVDIEAVEQLIPPVEVVGRVGDDDVGVDRPAIASASEASTRDRSVSPRTSRFSRSTDSAARSRSTNTQVAAPRDNASIPIAPLPAYRSATTASASTPALPSALNIASRTRSVVGRVDDPSGEISRRPPSSPATTRTRAGYGGGGKAAGRAGGGTLTPCSARCPRSRASTAAAGASC